MCQFKIKKKMEKNKCLQNYFDELKEKWMECHRTPGVFAYELNIKKSKRLPGDFQFYCELNAERATLRRKPDEFISLDPVFDENKFNFKKVKSQEVLLKFKYDSYNVTIIVNQSPLTCFHTLICPNLDAGLPQKITKEALEFSIHFLLSVNDTAIRIGYNSPGAAASVNHLHMHLLYIDFNLYLDSAKLEVLGDGETYRLACSNPTEGICFVFNKNTMSESDIDLKIGKIVTFLRWLCRQNHPHNIFITLDRCSNNNGSLKMFTFARKSSCVVKNLCFNIACLELSGFVPVGEETLYNDLTESKVIQEIKAQTGDVYKKVYNYFS